MLTYGTKLSSVMPSYTLTINLSHLWAAADGWLVLSRKAERTVGTTLEIDASLQHVSVIPNSKYLDNEMKSVHVKTKFIICKTKKAYEHHFPPLYLNYMAGRNSFISEIVNQMCCESLETS